MNKCQNIDDSDICENLNLEKVYPDKLKNIDHLIDAFHIPVKCRINLGLFPYHDVTDKLHVKLPHNLFNEILCNFGIEMALVDECYDTSLYIDDGECVFEEETTDCMLYFNNSGIRYFFEQVMNNNLSVRRCVIGDTSHFGK
jgi:hypothetical protein